MKTGHPQGVLIEAQHVRSGDMYVVYDGRLRKIAGVEQVEYDADMPTWVATNRKGVVIVFADNGSRLQRAPEADVEVLRVWS